MKKLFLMLVLMMGLIFDANSAGWLSYPTVSTLTGNETFLVATSTNNEQISTSDLGKWLSETIQTTNIANSVYSNNPSGYQTALQVTNIANQSAFNATNGFTSGLTSNQVVGIVNSNMVKQSFLPQFTDITNAVQELSLAGQLPYLSDFAAFAPPYSMTNLTWKGSPITLLNATNTIDGLKLFTNSSITFPCTLTSSNTVVIVFGFDPSFTPYFAENLFQATDTNTGSGVFSTLQTGYWMNFFALSNSTAYPSAVSLTNLMVDAWNNYGGWGTYPKSPRHVLAFTTDGNGNLYFFREGVAGTFYNNSAQKLNCPIFSTNSLNQIRIGAGGVFSSYGIAATIESIWLFNKAADTNLLQSSIFASDWTQRFTKKRFKIGDSLMSGNSYSNNLATMVDTSSGFNDAMIKPYYLGGANFNSSWNNITNSLFLFNQPHGKISEVQIDVAAGINDIYAGRSGALVFQLFSNLFISPIITNGVIPPNWKITMYNLNQTSTNGLSYPQVGSPAVERINFNNLLVSYQNLFFKIVNRDAVVTQSMLSTNRVPRLSIDGLHFADSTNGDSAYKTIAGEAMFPQNNPYLITNLPPELISGFPASNGLWTNQFNAPIFITLDNSAGVSVSNLKKNGVVFSATPPTAITFVLKPNDTFSETYVSGQPSATYVK